MARSIEEKVEDWCKDQLKGSYYTKTQPINAEIENALRKAPSKQGGTGRTIRTSNACYRRPICAVFRS